MKKLILQFLLVAHGMFIAGAQTTLVLQPNSLTGNDTYILDYFPDNSYGTEDRISVNAWMQSNDPYISRGLIQFDLSGIPAGSLINSAYLSLYHNPTSIHYNGVHSGPNNFIIQRVTSSWYQNTVTWNNQPATTHVNQAILPATIIGTQSFPNIDVTAMVSNMITVPGSGHGFMIRLVNETIYRNLLFASSNHADSTVRPKLVITYLTTGIEDLNHGIDLIVFPNPVQDVVHVSLTSTSYENCSLRITDAIGKVLMHEKISVAAGKNDYEYKLGTFPPGIYTLTLQHSKATVHRRIVRE